MLDKIKSVGALVLMLVLVVAVVSPVLATSFELSGERTTVETAADAGESVQLSGGNITNISVYQSLGTKGSFDNGYATGPMNWTPDESWTLSTWTSIDDPANRTGEMTVVTADSRATIVYNGTADEWVGYVYSDSTQRVYRVAAAATNESATTFLTLERSGNTVYLTQNTTTLATATLDAGNETSSEVNASNLHGTLEETRLYDVRVSTAERDALYNSPVQPISAPRVARVMYDSWDNSLSGIPIFGGGTLSATGATVVDGFPGATVTSSDYDVGSEVTRTSGSVLENSPMYVSYEATLTGPFVGVLLTLENVGASVLSLLAIGALMVAGLWIFDAMDDSGF